MGGITQIAFAYDVVPVKNAARLVPEDLHGDVFGHTAPDVVPRCRPAKVVRGSPSDAGSFACAPPRGIEIADGFPVAGKNVRDDATLFAFDRRGGSMPVA